ncbi:dual OB domain-containing protein [Geobacillus zalihae]|uniref:dual OB domain-containing protein n=1 Tax=Geobacillus zalihae TaxID=213419 RepID=UPI0016817CD9|nr:hypothetical protein [Geobacillus zalihae]QNU25065.1 hypothetical protein IC806_01720 [Geobacillus zalihae]
MYIVTGLTKMQNNRVCMSVYDEENNCYRRPIFLRDPITYHTVQNITLFSIIELTPIHHQHNIISPHTEDFPVEDTTQFTQIGRLNTNEQIKLLKKISVPSVIDVFGYDDNNTPFLTQQRGRFFVWPNSGIRSLGTVQAQEARLYEDDFGKIRVDFTDLTGQSYNNLPFVSIEQDHWKDRRSYINKFNRTSANEIFVRLSLSRPFQPSNWGQRACFLQVSCIHRY